ncbi:hypothetical protein C9890_0189 [Perkinsus sp. BL_2016]|nr:hypothetical protein C9890_0189 [Perkinsus sp. BL_2016]
MRSQTTRRPSTSIPVVGSSKIINRVDRRLPFATARSTDSLLFCPPDKVVHWWSITSSSPSRDVSWLISESLMPANSLAKNWIWFLTVMSSQNASSWRHSATRPDGGTEKTSQFVGT